jgi:outer membrane receptor protein involved in Fe transport
MNRMQRKKLSLAVFKALSAGAAVGLASPLAYGQQAAPPVEKVQKITVTGSRIPLQTLESESPVNILSAQDIAYTGLTSISEIINQLPQAFADLGSNEANGATGTSTVNLRGLGAARTLVLIDGRRLPAGDPQSYPTDLNWIPAPLIQRVDVLTGGASSIYGSDAVAGVVNFIMNDHFEGVQFSWQGNWYQHDQHDGSGVSSAVADRALTNPSQFQVPGDVSAALKAQDFSFILGSNFAGGKGNATVYFEYKKLQPVTQATRDFSACAAGLSDDETAFNCGGSSTSFPGRFLSTAPGSKSFTIADAAGNVRPFNANTDQFNFGPYNYFQVPDERYIANFFAHYDAFPNVRVYTEFDFMDEKTVLQIAPSGIFFGGPGQIYQLFDNNPLLTPSFKAAMGITPATPQSILIGRRNIEGGGRQDTPEHTDYRIVIGAKGDFLDGKWDYDAWWQSGKVVFQDTYLNDFSATRVGKALNVVTDPVTKQPVCASVLDGSDPLCVPYDIFHLGGVTQAALNYVQTPGFKNGETFQDVMGLHISSDLGEAYGWRLPLAKSGIGVAFGIERRTEKVNLQVDEFFAVPLGTGQGGPTLPINGQYTVKEAFGEVRVPIMENQPWAQALNFNGSYRYSDYSTGPTTNTYGLGAEWAPVKQARLRGTYQKATRAPNVIELFQAQGFNLFNLVSDPCGPSKTATLAQCLLTGLNPAQYGAEILDSPAGQYNYLQGGNPSLKPEDSKSYTIGLVLNPIANLSATVDYWQIKVTNVIGVIPPTFTLTTCLATGSLCNLIHRDPTFSALWVNGGNISGLNLNLGSLKTDGIDVTVNYAYPMEKWGSLSFAFAGTWVNQFIVEPVPGFGTYDCAGLFGNTCTPAVPTWRSNVQAVWNAPWNFNVGGRWRYTSSLDLDTCQSNPLLNGDCPDKNHKLGVRNYIDLFGQWNINKNFAVRAGVNNVFDRDPPISENGIGQLPFWNGNTFPQVYDTLGRNFFMNVTAKF